MKVYIAGKISGLDRRDVVFKFGKASIEQKKQGNTVFLPTVLPESDSITQKQYLHICFAMIDVCDAVFLLPDWIDSAGAKKEKEYAEKSGKKIIYAEV